MSGWKEIKVNDKNSTLYKKIKQNSINICRRRKKLILEISVWKTLHGVTCKKNSTN